MKRLFPVLLLLLFTAVPAVVSAGGQRERGDDLLAGAPPSVVRAVAGARLLAADGDTTAACRRLRDWLREHRDAPHPVVLAELGACLAARDSLTSALDAYTAAARLAPDRAELWRAAGTVAYRLGRHATAARLLARAALLPGRREPGFWRLAASAGALAADTALVRLASDSLLAHDPADPAAWHLAAGARHAVGDDRGAAACLELLAARRPLPLPDRLLLAGLYERLGVPVLAARWYRAALADTAAPGLFLRLGEVLAAAGADSAAEAAWREGLRRAPSARLRLALGNLLLRTGRCTAARPHLEAAVASPDSAVVRTARKLLAWLRRAGASCQEWAGGLY